MQSPSSEGFSTERRVHQVVPVPIAEDLDQLITRLEQAAQGLRARHDRL